MLNGLRHLAIMSVVVLSGTLTVSVPLPAAANSLTPQQAVDQGVAAAAEDGVHQHVALVDRSTGALVASSGGDTQVISESIVKLFTVAYYLVKYDGTLPSAMAADLHEMIVHSDDRIESEYWTTAAVPAMAARYGLAHTANGAKTGPHDWGWEYITADDEATFLYKASKDPIVGSFLMDAMANVASVGSDGFDQDFGFNSLSGDHGSKQGWTDRNTSAAINIHSVGWTDKYFGAILETSDSPQYDAMRADSTATADLIDGLRSASDLAAARRASLAQAEALTAAIRTAITGRIAQLHTATIDVLTAAGLLD
ncbi:hypothetical protein SAMN04515671_0673 [Nakamurella panacisegetis]|uniref:Beta-lactamase enzyme family protein n=1 Tax=Nakamurella panacisegetis TaxID=1090615 RepID=A0A1H0IWC9_9ACTN|nr:hypothetical protein SAMN04515671_0673 [Nakamurella panacisegetis]